MGVVLRKKRGGKNKGNLLYKGPNAFGKKKKK